MKKSYVTEEHITVENVSVSKKVRIPRIGTGIYLDLRDRLPIYWADWKDSLDYRVIPSLIATYFENLLPAIAFAQDMFDRTDNSYGVNEILLSSAMAGIIFGILSGQPLCIVGVTGPITIFNYTVYEIIKPLKINYFGFMFWISIWAMVLHLIIAIMNVVAFLQYVTTFPCDIFGLFINIIYIQKGIQILTNQFNDDTSSNPLASGFANVTVALLMFIFGFTFKQARKFPILTERIRCFISDYSTALSVLFWSAFIHFGGDISNVHFSKLPITKSFIPTANNGSRDRSTWLAYESIMVGNVFLALPFGIILTILFYFDHNVSSLMAQNAKYKLTKPSAFHWDFFLLGITTGISGVLGLPAPNGLIPQAPLHTESLLVYGSSGNVIKCVEQRFTNTVQGILMLATMARPFLICLGQIPQAVLSGLFFIMGFEGLMGNAIISRIVWIFTDSNTKADSKLSYLSYKKIALFVSFSMIGFTAEFAITNTKGAIGFPIVLLLTVIFTFVFPMIFTEEELDALNPSVAQKFTIKNLLLETLSNNKEIDNDEDILAATDTAHDNIVRTTAYEQ
ncbi:hypothetical protein KAFR_0H00170 [Kazachstania africana CBS 2517]|uniref:Bicarbonate transporter-like transmembrane domain-containing protein n=1 Tax=Kazachstania africana (strain ATCC 22294 / BCRC 22015 / CBS 2517 / CECT 1963 / NBRC 1671 / NRRL Y-8276) TaxID=1071382 RepID=H2AYM0_KAZAF|nr:hypothetical protein KAFR_0H00170 [Kazachstania africana CBS 2517]CCF59426.1 hypothetical protein KAFR_0H00170 [Kazachstania africana CBS 2517]